MLLSPRYNFKTKKKAQKGNSLASYFLEGKQMLSNILNIPI